MAIKDPTDEEMREFLITAHIAEHGEEPEVFDVEEAIYWFAYSWHGGQASNLYSALSTSEYTPGPICNGPEKDSISADMLANLEIEYAEVQS